MPKVIKWKQAPIDVAVLDLSSGTSVPLASTSRCYEPCQPQLNGDGEFDDDLTQLADLAEELSESGSEPSPAVSPLLGVSADGREGTWAVALPRSRHGRLAVAVVALRAVQFSGGSQLISWCNNLACSSREHFDAIFSGSDFPHQIEDAILRGSEPLCACGQAVVRAAGAGSTAAVVRLLGSSRGTDVPGRTVFWQHDGKLLHCTRAGGASAGWGVVCQHGNAAWCLTCPSQQRRCMHVLTGSQDGGNE